MERMTQAAALLVRWHCLHSVQYPNRSWTIRHSFWTLENEGESINSFHLSNVGRHLSDSFQNDGNSFSQERSRFSKIEIYNGYKIIKGAAKTPDILLKSPNSSQDDCVTIKVIFHTWSQTPHKSVHSWVQCVPHNKFLFPSLFPSSETVSDSMM